MEKKNLLIATDCFLPRWDGIARFLSEVIPPLTKKYNVTVIAPRFPGKYKNILNIKLIRFPLKKISFGDYTPPVTNNKVLKSEIKKADIIFSQTIGPIGMNAIKIAKRLKKPIIAYTHSIEWELVPNSFKNRLIKTPVNILTKIMAKKVLNKCDLLLVPSLEIAEKLSWQGIKTKKKIVALGTDADKFTPPKDKNKAKEKLNIEPEKIVIGFTGRLGREKDLPTLYFAFRRLEKKYSNLNLLIVGKGVNDVKRLFIKNKNIKLVEFTNNVVPYLQAMDIYVLPSLTETTSIATLEAMSTGLPVVVTPVGSIPGYIKNNINGMFFPKREPYFLVKKISMLIDNPKLKESIGTNARNTIIENFTWKKTIEGIEEAFNEF